MCVCGMTHCSIVPTPAAQVQVTVGVCSLGVGEQEKREGEEGGEEGRGGGRGGGKGRTEGKEEEEEVKLILILQSSSNDHCHTLFNCKVGIQ